MNNISARVTGCGCMPAGQRTGGGRWMGCMTVMLHRIKGGVARYACFQAHDDKRAPVTLDSRHHIRTHPHTASAESPMIVAVRRASQGPNRVYILPRCAVNWHSGSHYAGRGSLSRSLAVFVLGNQLLIPRSGSTASTLPQRLSSSKNVTEKAGGKGTVETRPTRILGRGGTQLGLYLCRLRVPCGLDGCSSPQP